MVLAVGNGRVLRSSVYCASPIPRGCNVVGPDVVQEVAETSLGFVQVAVTVPNGVRVRQVFWSLHSSPSPR